MRISTEQLLGELVDRWALGKPLEVEELLGRAGPQADELAALIDAFLVRAPRREPTPEALAAVRALAEPPLLRARQALGLKLDDLAAGLVESLGLRGRPRAQKVRRYYQELELGQLDPAGVAASVWDCLSGAARAGCAWSCARCVHAARSQRAHDDSRLRTMRALPREQRRLRR